MRNLIAVLFALFLAAPATAQQFPTVHDRTVIGRIGTGSGSGPSQEIPFANLGPFIFQTITGDCAVTAPLGVLTIICTKTNGVPFVASATTDTTNATNIGSGTLANARLAGTQNTVKGAATSAVEADLAVPSCATASSALQWTTNTGPGCGTIPATIDNFLPNVQWQLWSGVTFGIKLNAAGTGSQATVACASFTTTSLNPVFTCANTQTMRPGDLAILSTVAFWNFTGAGAISCANVQCTPAEQSLGNYVTGVRIGAVATNTSVTIPSPGFGGVSPGASTAINIVPIAPGDLAGTGTNGPTGWIKTSTLIATIDDWGAAATPASTVYPGCERPLLLRKGATGNELFQANLPPNMIKKFAGQTVTFGVAIYHRVQGNANTGNIFIQDNTGTSFSSAWTGASLGGYQFLTVTRTFASNMTSGSFGFQPNGLTGDVMDICLPTAGFVPSMSQYQLHQNSSECISSRHWNPPLLDPFIITFPSSALVAGLWGWNGIDLEAISFGTVHNTVQYVWGDLEWTSANVATTANPSTVFFGSNTANLNFGIKAGTIVTGTTFSTSGTPVPLWTDGTVAFLTGVTALVPTNGTFDFWDVCVSPGSWNN